MTIQSANKELKSQKLPAAFRPNNAPAGLYAINVLCVQMYDAIGVMRNHGYERTETFDSVNADFMICFQKAR